ncbi:MAG: TonB-dependent receptor plug domain-containing protein, partial [bacterium]|nr:TonB-dependent receptor plug domain-containing protein [bacterium]
MRHLFCRTALVGFSLAILAPAAVFAQETPSVSAQPAELDEIVVTATRRTTNVLDVPVAVSTYDSKALERAGLADVKRLQSISPSLNVTTTQGDSQGAVIRVRGVGTSGSNPGLESATGVSIDGVFRSRSNVALGDLLAIDRIELLRGPQGTLFGKNTTAGVINILTKLPAFTPGTELTSTLGNYDLQQYSAGVTGPIVGDTLAGRLDVLYSHRDGWLKSPYSDQTFADRQRSAIRGQLYWTPSDDLKVRVIADYTKRDESTANPPTYRLVGPTGPLIGAFGPTPVAENQPTSDAPQIDNKSPRVDRYEEMGLSGEANWKVGPGTLTTITAYRVATPNRSFDVEGSPADLLRDIDDGERYMTFTQEVRYQGMAGDLPLIFHPARTRVSTLV